jgi:hypothetical protein
MVTGPPAATPVTTPAVVTLAMAGAELDQVNVLPVRVCPAAFRATAPNDIVEPIANVALGGDTLTLAMTVSGPGDAVTVIAAVPDTPDVVAVIVALPALTAVTVPDTSTDATAGAELDHAKVRFASGTPAAFNAVALSPCCAPAASEMDAGSMRTDATFTSGMMFPVTPSLVPPHAATVASHVTIPTFKTRELPIMDMNRHTENSG